MKFAVVWIGCRVLALAAVALFAAAISGGCYAGRDCKPGQACWQNCAANPGGPGCVDPWHPIPVGSARDAGPSDGGNDR